MRVSLFEIFLIQVVVYALIWLTDDYIGSYMSIVIPVLAAGVLVVALLSELIEPSRISRKYFWVMGISIATPLLVGAFFMVLHQGELQWMEGI